MKKDGREAAGVPWWITKPAQIDEIKAALERHMPRLRFRSARVGDFGVVDPLVVEGVLELQNENDVFDRYSVQLWFDRIDADAPPSVWEVDGRIPRIAARHVNPADGSCCIQVPGEWLLRDEPATFEAFLLGPMRDYFVSQSHFEMFNEWPFGERPHGMDGFIQAHAEALSVPNTRQAVRQVFFIFAHMDWKGHWRCPCESGRNLRDCCFDRLSELKVKISPEEGRKLLELLHAMERQLRTQAKSKARARKGRALRRMVW